MVEGGLLVAELVVVVNTWTSSDVSVLVTDETVASVVAMVALIFNAAVILSFRDLIFLILTSEVGFKKMI